MINVKINDYKFVQQVLTNKEKCLEHNGESVTLFWSGGVDSTYMLFWLLAHGYEVHTIYCELENNFHKVKRENWARKKIKEWIDVNAPDIAQHWYHNDEPISKISVRTGGFRSNLAQAPLWLLNTQFIGGYGGYYADALPTTYVISYVNGDDALHWIPSFNKIIEGYNMLAKEGEQITVVFPLISLKKSFFYEALKPLYGLMTWCEMEVLKKNCDCKACIRHRHELSVFESKI